MTTCAALKKDGVALYKLARQGETIERPPRPLHIASFTVWRQTPDSQDVHFEVACSKGTYVRSLAHDLGSKLGTHAHLIALRRERIGHHSVADAWALHDLVGLLRTESQPTSRHPTASG
jgi:tRNA pseudouridine55 synthase